MEISSGLMKRHFRNLTKWKTLFSIWGVVFLLSSCIKDDGDIIEEFPSLKVVNETNDSNNRSITSINLVGYEFTNLNINSGDFQIFKLDSGMPGGYDKININVRLSGPQIVTRNIEVNFKKGETTTITMKGCISSEGCSGFFLE